jgi:hypothetical protein
MRTAALLKAALWVALFAGASAAGLKYVAVVETDVDAQSGVSALLNPADIRHVTAELRREAVKNLPAGQYNIMTTETVYSQGSAVLEACADENCVIALGSRIGADFIVRGTISKLQTKITLVVEIYETADGNLVAQSDPVRYENIEELIEKAGAACAEMYKAFVNTQSALALQKQKSAAADAGDGQNPAPAITPHQPEHGERQSKKFSAGGGVFFASDLGGGLVWENSGEALAMPYYGGGLYLFFDAGYVEAFAGYSAGGGRWKSPAATLPQDSLPDMARSYINIGAFAKYPVAAGSVKLFPLIGIDYEASLSGERKYDDGREIELDEPTSAVWFKLGGGGDLELGGGAYIRAELLYGWRTANDYENKMLDLNVKKNPNSGGLKTMAGGGLSFKAGVGVKF